MPKAIGLLRSSDQLKWLIRYPTALASFEAAEQSVRTQKPILGVKDGDQKRPHPFQQRQKRILNTRAREP
jgi:hypothetical protein